MRPREKLVITGGDCTEDDDFIEGYIVDDHGKIKGETKKSL